MNKTPTTSLTKITKRNAVIVPFNSKKIFKTMIEEKVVYIKFISKFGDTDDLSLLQPYFLHSNSLLREEILTLLLSFYKRGLLSSSEVKDKIDSILITSNHMRAEFKLKQLIRIIYREIE